MTDRRTLRLVVGLAGAVVLLVVAGSFALLLDNRDLDPALVGIGGTALGGLLGLLVPSGDRAEVTIAQPANRPVPVSEVDSEAGVVAWAEVAVVVCLVVLVLILLGVVR